MQQPLFVFEPRADENWRVTDGDGNYHSTDRDSE